jgi:hypothetical protein
VREVCNIQPNLDDEVGSIIRSGRALGGLSFQNLASLGAKRPLGVWVTQDTEKPVGATRPSFFGLPQSDRVRVTISHTVAGAGL